MLTLGLGLLTSLYGVMFSAVQTDMKRLLAYSSIENIGFIFIGLGLAITFRAYGMVLELSRGAAAGRRGTVRYRFRVRVPREAGFPYTSGTSRLAHVTVRGL